MSDLATAGRLRPSTTQFPASWYCDPAGPRSRAADPARARARLRGPRAHGAQRGRLSGAGAQERGADARPQRGRHRAPVQRLPPSPGAHAQRPRHDAGDRVPAASLDVRSSRRAPRRAALSREPVPQPRAHAAAELERPAVRRPARRRARPRGARREGFRLQRLRLRPRRDASRQLQLEVLHRGLSRGLPRRPVPSRARPVRDVRRSSLGVRRLVFGADGRRQQQAGQGRARASTSAGTRRCSTSTAAKYRSTAPSGSRTTRTSCSSGIRTCSSSAR